MFFISIENPIDLRGEKQHLYHDMKKRYGIGHGIHCVKNGLVRGPDGEARYWEFQEIMAKLPTYKGSLKSYLPQDEDGKKVVTMDVYWPDGLLMQPAMKMEVLENYDLYESEGGRYLCLCKSGDYYFQVIVA